MNLIEEDFRALLVNDQQIIDLFVAQGVDIQAPGAVSYNTTEEDAPEALRIWFQRNDTPTDDFLNGSVALERALIDLEVVGLDMLTTLKVVKRVKEFKTYSGSPTGNNWILAIDVTDHADDYVYHSDFNEQGLTVASVQVELML